MKSIRPPKTIGILGGMGPQATILLQQKILDSVVANDDAGHIPLLVDSNSQVPSRLEWIINNQGQDPGPVLGAMAQRLELAGAAALAMPCNTAHHFASTIQQCTSIPLLNVLDLVNARCSELCHARERIGILASPATRTIQLFEKSLASVELCTVWPNESIDLLQTIRDIKSRGVTDADRVLLQTAADDCVRRGATCLLVGCTEFSLMSGSLSLRVPVVDSLDLLVQRIREVAFSLSSDHLH